MYESYLLTVAFFFGILARYLKFPPLVGFLIAGIVISQLNAFFSLPNNLSPILDYLAHTGVLMLLFTVGLKLNFKQVIKPQVIGGGGIHFALTSLIYFTGIYFVFDVSIRDSLLLALCASFSSTVLAAKLLETKKELKLFHGRTSIGILILQDIIALIIVGFLGEKSPTPWAFCVLLLPLFRPFLYKVVSITGHGELMVLVSILLSIVVGGFGFESVGLSSEIGALAIGALLSNHPRTKELSNALWSLKELFLVCFFLKIGMAGIPNLKELYFSLFLMLLLPIKTLLFFFLLIQFKLRSRTATLSSLSLTAYSEFGLIVLAVVSPNWLLPFALSVVLSFIISAPLNRYAHKIFEKFESLLVKFEKDSLHPDEQPKNLGKAEILIFGMGRTGTAAYKELSKSNMHIVGLDADKYVVKQNIEKGRNVFFADAEDSDFWRNLNFKKIKAVILTINDIEAKLISIKMLKRGGFKGSIISNALYEDHQERIDKAGATHTYLTMVQAGSGLARTTLSILNNEKP